MPPVRLFQFCAIVMNSSKTAIVMMTKEWLRVLRVMKPTTTAMAAAAAPPSTMRYIGGDAPHLAENRAGVHTDVEVHAVPERDVAGEATDDVPAGRHDRVKHADDEHRFEIPRAAAHEGVEEDEQDQDGADDVGRLLQCTHVVTSSRVFSPSRPSGRNSRTTRITPKKIAALHCGM